MVALALGSAAPDEDELGSSLLDLACAGGKGSTFEEAHNDICIYAHIYIYISYIYIYIQRERERHIHIYIYIYICICIYYIYIYIYIRG